MKRLKFFSFILVIVMLLQLAGCGKKYQGDVDVDLTTMSGTMVYSYVADMLANPESYRGQVVRMHGDSNMTHGGSHSCIVYDALGCCTEGIEYVLADEELDYPDDGDSITVVGTFATYSKGGNTYFTLVNSILE